MFESTVELEGLDAGRFNEDLRDDFNDDLI